MPEARDDFSVTATDSASASSADHDLVGRMPSQFDGYRLLGEIGRGGMGVVFAAEDTQLGRRVAIKTLLTPNRSREDTLRFEIEARALARLAHPNVLSVYRAGEVAGIAYLVSEYVDGCSLDRIELPVSAEELARIATEIAAGLAAVHRGGVLHRDLKPSNVLRSRRGEIKLCDFGIARLFDDAETREAAGQLRGGGHDFTGPGWLGTPRYLAPEIWEGQRASVASDRYALGAVLYRLASGLHAIDGTDLAGLRVAVAAGPRPLALVAPDVDPRFAQLVDRCLDRDPRRRPASADTLRAEFAGIAAARQVRGEDGPYRGLRAYETKHQHLFFARRLESLAILEQLRSSDLVVIAGDSGVGKSSLAHAGVVPLALTGSLAPARTWTTCVMRPGHRPVVELAQALHALLPGDVTELAQRLRHAPREIVREVAAALGDSHGVLLLVDQLEELVSDGDRDDRDAVAIALGQLAHGVPGFKILATVRSDFLTRTCSLPVLGPLLRRSIYVLGPLDVTQIREVVVGPAEAVGYRFESESMVESLVLSVDDATRGLPLVQFALQELWRARDVQARLLTERAFVSMGGVGAALARHADGLLASLPGDARSQVKDVVLQLVTPQRTRAERGEGELLGLTDGARRALAHLVDGRLVVARSDESGRPRYELAHESLITQWDTLRGWLDNEQEKLALSERARRAELEWRRLGRLPSTLWSEAQLAEVERVGLLPAVGAATSEFLAASHGSVRRRRWMRRIALMAVPVVALLGWGALVFKEKRDLQRAVERQLALATEAFETAEASASVARASWKAAMAEFDAGRAAAAEELVDRARREYEEASEQYLQALRPLELALQMDFSRADARASMSRVLLLRALFAEVFHDEARVREAVDRARTVGDGKTFERVWWEPGKLTVSSDPVGAEVSMAEYQVVDARLTLGLVRKLGSAPVRVELAPGSYLVTLNLKGRPQVKYPVRIERGEQRSVTIMVPAEVPSGFIYVPAGRFLYGSTDDDVTRRADTAAEVQHSVESPAFYIARHEVTWKQWIEYVDALESSQRRAAMPDSGKVRLLLDNRGEYTLVLQPSSVRYEVKQGDLLEYVERSRNVRQDWLSMPVTGVSMESAVAYASWLSRTGRVPGARICRNQEWERAARGADERLYPSGNAIGPSDANFDESYGRKPGAFGPDEVGSYPASNSPFDVADMVGNAWEQTLGDSGALYLRGGGYYNQIRAAMVSRRFASERELTFVDIGVRLCTDVSN